MKKSSEDLIAPEHLPPQREAPSILRREPVCIERGRGSWKSRIGGLLVLSAAIGIPSFIGGRYVERAAVAAKAERKQDMEKAIEEHREKLRHIRQDFGHIPVWARVNILNDLERAVLRGGGWGEFPDLDQEKRALAWEVDIARQEIGR